MHLRRLVIGREISDGREALGKDMNPDLEDFDQQRHLEVPDSIRILTGGCSNMTRFRRHSRFWRPDVYWTKHLIHPSIHPSIRPSIRPSTNIHPFVRPSTEINPSINIHPSVNQSIKINPTNHQSINQSINQYPTISPSTHPLF